MEQNHTIDSTQEVETTTSSILTINIGPADLEIMSNSLEKSLLTSQLELAEAEQKVLKLRTEISRVAVFLSTIKKQLKG